MHLIKHRYNHTGNRNFSIIGVELCRLHVVAARLDLLSHQCRRRSRRAVWLPEFGVWAIVYRMKGRRLADIDEFERQYYAARRVAQVAEFGGARLYAAISPLKKPKPRRVLRPSE